MTSPEIIFRYFPDLNAQQKQQFTELKSTYEFWNKQINVISRKDFEEFYERHVLHSLAIAKVLDFKPGSYILDIGTGGGFPGIPLAILYPECHFHLVDSIGKKIKVVQEVAKAAGLKNIEATHERAEKINGKFDFIVSRAVTAMPEFITWTRNKISTEQKNKLKNGILYLKGGDLSEEMKPVRQKVKFYPISSFFKEDFFETKKVVYVNLSK